MRLAVVLGLVTIILSPIIASAQEAGLEFTDFELDLENVIATKGSNEEKLVWLEEAKQRHHPLTFSERQYYNYMQCRHGHFPEGILDPDLNEAKADSSAAHYLCTSFQESISGDDAFKAIYLAYTLEDSIQSAPLRFIVAFRYALIAYRKQLLNSGMEATLVMLAIARANQLEGLLALSLAERALFLAEAGLIDEAIATNTRALALVSTDEDWNHFMLDRGYMLSQAKRFDEAKSTYAEILEHPNDKNNLKSQFIVKSNLAYIYTITGEVEKNLQVTKEMQYLADQLDNEMDIKWAKSSRAFALLADGKIDEAKPLFDESVEWFQENQYDSNLVDIYEGWATTLMEQGRPEEAYASLVESLRVREGIELTRMETESQLFDWILEAEQSARELTETKQSIALMEKDRAAQRNLFIAIFVGLVIIIAIGGIAYRKLRGVNKRLDQANTALDYENNHDHLTGALNRRYFQAFIKQTTLSTGKSLNALIALVDIDHFKSINDTYGHDVGDEILKIVVQRMLHNVKENDKVIRWGGEEFLIYIELESAQISSQSAISRVLKAINENPIHIGENIFNVTASMGFKTSPSAIDFHAEIRVIDELLYRAKASGRHRAIGFEENSVQEIVIM
ncbi:MAG TPA: diguanylate cyclase [Pseudidiomarina sp.]|nr:diguanylate cyclase [Pseudidiomarina sp.]